MPHRSFASRSTPPALIRRVREDVLHLTREQFAPQLEVSPFTLRNWERQGAPRLVRFALLGFLAVKTTADVRNSILWPEK